MLEPKEFAKRIVALYAPAITEEHAIDLALELEANFRRIYAEPENAFLIFKRSLKRIDQAYDLAFKISVYKNFDDLENKLEEYVNEFVSEEQSEQVVKLLQVGLFRMLPKSNELYRYARLLAYYLFDALIGYDNLKKSPRIVFLIGRLEEFLVDYFDDVKEEVDAINDAMEALLKMMLSEELKSEFTEKNVRIKQLNDGFKELLKFGTINYERQQSSTVTEIIKEIVSDTENNDSLSAEQKLVTISRQVDHIREHHLTELAQMFRRLFQHLWQPNYAPEDLQAMDIEQVLKDCYWDASESFENYFMHDAIRHKKYSGEVMEYEELSRLILSFPRQEVFALVDDANVEERVNKYIPLALMEFFNAARTHDMHLWFESTSPIDNEYEDSYIMLTCYHLTIFLENLPEKMQSLFFSPNKKVFNVDDILAADFDSWEFVRGDIEFLIKRNFVVGFLLKAMDEDYKREIEQNKINCQKEMAEIPIRHLYELQKKEAKGLEKNKAEKLLLAIKKMNKSMFDVFLNQCNLPSLIYVVEHLPLGVDKDSDMVRQVTMQILKLERPVRYTTAVQQAGGSPVFRSMPDELLVQRKNREILDKGSVNLKVS